MLELFLCLCEGKTVLAPRDEHWRHVVHPDPVGKNIMFQKKKSPLAASASYVSLCKKKPQGIYFSLYQGDSHKAPLLLSSALISKNQHTPALPTKQKEFYKTCSHTCFLSFFIYFFNMLALEETPHSLGSWKHLMGMLINELAASWPRNFENSQYIRFLELIFKSHYFKKLIQSVNQELLVL